MSAPTTSPAPATPTPTAPGRLPLLGHAHRLARDPLPFMTSLREHGSVVRIGIGPTDAYVVTDPALTRRVLVTDAANFKKGGKIFDTLRVFLGDGLATIADGDTHMRNRRLMQPMFNKAHITGRGEAVVQQVRAQVGAWHDGGTRDVFADMNEVALGAFLVALFGTDLAEHLAGEFTTLMPEIMTGSFRQTILPSWITRLPLPANRAYAQRLARLRTLIDQAIDHHVAATAAAETPPIEAAGCPHAAAQQERAETEEGLFRTLVAAEEQMSRQQLQDEVITLLTGAIETTGTTLAWTLYELARHSEVERRLREELDSVCGDRPLRYEDVARLPYSRRVVQEAMRKYGPAWMLTRVAARDIDLGGHRIPEGANVVWSPYLHQHDPAVFRDPEAFDPDRWTAERAPATRGSFLAFGDGRRKCIGEYLAWVELQIILATILQTWSRFETVSRPPRPQAAVTVSPDVLDMVFHG